MEDRTPPWTTPRPGSFDAIARGNHHRRVPDQRNENREPLSLRVEYENMNSFFADYTRNISRGGTFIVTEQPFPIGTEFVFQLVVPRAEAPVSLHGIVRWVLPPDRAVAGQDAGMGIEFLFATDEDRDAVARLVEGWMQESFGPKLVRLLTGGGPPKRDDD